MLVLFHVGERFCDKGGRAKSGCACPAARRSTVLTCVCVCVCVCARARALCVYMLIVYIHRTETDYSTRGIASTPNNMMDVADALDDAHASLSLEALCELLWDTIPSGVLR